jgi:mono/diheme cytochrome c family protein
MKAGISILLFLLGAMPSAVPAQQAKSNSTAPLSDTQIVGRRLLHQRCAVCHTEATPGARRYGPVLYKELVIGNEDSIRQFIRNGSPGKMPGFKYGLEDSEINAIVEYLKTVPRPARPGGPVKEGPLD